jgi:hypothetical protein
MYMRKCEIFEKTNFWKNLLKKNLCLLFMSPARCFKQIFEKTFWKKNICLLFMSPARWCISQPIEWVLFHLIRHLRHSVIKVMTLSPSSLASPSSLTTCITSHYDFTIYITIYLYCSISIAHYSIPTDPSPHSQFLRLSCSHGFHVSFPMFVSSYHSLTPFRFLLSLPMLAPRLQQFLSDDLYTQLKIDFACYDANRIF